MQCFPPMSTLFPYTTLFRSGLGSATSTKRPCASVRPQRSRPQASRTRVVSPKSVEAPGGRVVSLRSEEHTSELQSRPHLVCRLLLEKKNLDREWRCLVSNTS